MPMLALIAHWKQVTGGATAATNMLTTLSLLVYNQNTTQLSEASSFQSEQLGIDYFFVLFLRDFVHVRV